MSDLLTARQLATHLGVSRQRVYQLRDAGIIQPALIYYDRRLLFDRAEVERILRVRKAVYGGKPLGVDSER